MCTTKVFVVADVTLGTKFVEVKRFAEDLEAFVIR